jgi:hypothetical protein
LYRQQIHAKLLRPPLVIQKLKINRNAWISAASYRILIYNNQVSNPPIHLHLIFEISSLKNQVRRTGFFVYFELDFYCLCSLKIPYESPIVGQLLDLISPATINLFEPRFKSYDPSDMANCLLWFYSRILKVGIFYCEKTKYEVCFFCLPYSGNWVHKWVRVQVPKYGSPTRVLFRSWFLSTDFDKMI